jgi:hypothetical protein
MRRFARHGGKFWAWLATGRTLAWKCDRKQFSL